MSKKISIMTPCYNEELNIEQCYLKVKEVMTSQLSRYSYEHLFIDNCSTDGTVSILKDIAAKDMNVKIIVNSRNFGPHRSPYYGILQTSGDAVIPLVADLQMPPRLIVDFVEKWEAGYKMVIAVRTGMRESIILRSVRKLFYRVISRLSNIEQIRHFIGFGLFDRQIVDIMRAMDDPCPYFRGMMSEIGFEKAYIEYEQPSRKHGTSKNTLNDLIEYAIVGISSYSKAPLRIATIIGFATSMISFLVAVVYFILKLLFWNAFPMGTAPIIISLFFVASIQLLCIGFLGEYIGLIYEHVKKRPLVIEKERVNFD